MLVVSAALLSNLVPIKDSQELLVVYASVFVFPELVNELLQVVALVGPNL